MKLFFGVLLALVGLAATTMWVISLWAYASTLSNVTLLQLPLESLLKYFIAAGLIRGIFAGVLGLLKD